MKTGSNPSPPLRPGDATGSGLFRVAIVGAATLKGRELADVLRDRGFPSRDIRLLDDDESLGQLEAVGDEPSFIQSVLPENLEHVEFAFFASDEKFTRSTWAMAKEAGSDVIDLSHGLAGQDGVVVRAPWIERELGSVLRVDLTGAVVLVAHPASVALALLLLRAAKAGAVVRSIATVCEPASERGKRGMDELHEQTVNLLSFQQLPKTVFDTQVAFNLVDRYGRSSQPSLESVERIIRSDFQQIVSGKAEVPSLMLVQAPIFHGYAISLYLELQESVSIEELKAALSGEHVDIWHGEDDAPSNVNSAGQEQIQLAVRRDSVRESGFWIWATMDNLRVAAVAAVECAESLIPSRPRGTVQ